MESGRVHAVNKTMHGLFVAAAIALLAPFVSEAKAQKYPERPVKIVLPFGAGGVADVTARILAEKLGDRLGQRFVVENMPGAGGISAANAVIGAPADGYTIGFVTNGTAISAAQFKNLPFDPVRDFAPITLVAVSPNVLVVNPSIAAASVGELVALVKASPGKYSFASPGVGSTPHLSGALFKHAFGLDLVHVPFNGAGPAITSTIAGHTPIAFTALPPAVAHAQSGKLRALAVMSAKRAVALPDVPTIAEAGVSDQEADTLTGLLAPAGTPEEIVDLLQRQVARIVALPDVKERLTALGFEPVADTPEQFGALIKVEMAKWGRVVREANIRIE